MYIPIGVSEEEDDDVEDEDEEVLGSAASWLVRLHSRNLFNLD